MKTFFDQLQINSKEISNRFLVAPMSRVSADAGGVPTPEMYDYYTAFATGGFGGIITEGLYTDELYSRSYPNQPGIVNPAQVEAWSKINKTIHHNKALVIAQLMHAGAISQALADTVAPSALQPLGAKLPAYGGSGAFAMARAMTLKDIGDVIEGYIQSAKNASDAGFDGIELHGANGYLLDQFLTPYLNQRTDAYGGSIKNALRIVAQIVEGIKAAVPGNFIVGLRISEGKVNNLDYRWEQGSTWAKALLAEIRHIPIDYLHIAAEHKGWLEETLYADGSSLSGLARAILDCPVIANGKLHDLALADKLLQTGQADLFAIGKMAIANPDFVHRVRHNLALTPFRKEMLYPDPTLWA